MLKIDPDGLYERDELAQAFPHIEKATLTRCMLAWGGSRPYPGSRKLFIRGDVLMKAMEPKQEPPPPVQAEPTRDGGKKIITGQRLKAW